MAYQAYCEAGWNGITSPPEFEGHGQPESLGVAVKEIVASANLSFSLGPQLTIGAVQALLTCASDELKATYLPKMVSGNLLVDDLRPIIFKQTYLTVL